MAELVLEQFIEEKKEQYKEPERKGTPRGRPVGFSKRKYLSSLWMMTNLIQKDIAGKTGVSYGLLRKWNTQEGFKDVLRDHCDEFAGLFIGHIKTQYKEELKRRKALSEDILREEPFRLTDDFFSGLKDCHLYGSFLIRRISHLLGTAIKDTGDTDFITVALAAVEHLLACSEKQSQQSLWSLAILKSGNIREVRLGLLNRIKEIILLEDLEK
jgi:hypothetical protein